MIDETVSLSKDVCEMQATNDPALIPWEEFIGFINDIQVLLPIFLFILLAIIIVLRKSRWMNSLTLNTLNNLKQSGKYIKEIYVEPYGVAEAVRYFLFGSEKKRQIIRRYYSLFIGSYRECLEKHGHFAKINSFMSWSKIQSQIDKELKFISRIEKFRAEETEEGRDYELFVLNYKYYKQVLDDILQDVKMVRAKYCHLTGTAGCGKTNIMCSMAEAALSKKFPCILICADDIKGNVSHAINQALNLPAFVAKHAEMVFFFTNFLCWIQHKKLIIMIDAINENDSTIFAETINEFVEKMCKYSNTKILFSCREEYYEKRTSRYMKRPSVPLPYVYRPNYTVNHNKLSEILIPAYKKYFCFTGVLSDRVEYMLRTNMLLLRVFFEAFRGSSEHIVTINKYQVFKKYISLITQDDVSDMELLETIVSLMIEKSTFDKIQLSNFAPHEQEKLKKIACDGGVLLVTKLVENPQSIIEREYECISFVYDELRDYCLARYLLMNRKDELMRILGQMKQKVATPLEGIVKYCYEHYKEQKQFSNAEKLLYEYGNEQSKIEERYFDSHSIGLSMLFESGKPCADYEIRYLINNVDLANHIKHKLELIDLLSDEKRNPNIATRFVEQLLCSKNVHKAIDFATYFLNSFYELKEPWYSDMAENIRVNHYVWKTEGVHSIGYVRFFACIIALHCKKNEILSIANEAKDCTLSDIFVDVRKQNMQERNGMMACILENKDNREIQNIMFDYFWNEKHGFMLKREEEYNPAYTSIKRFYYKNHRIFALPLLMRLKIKPHTYMGTRIKLLFREFTSYSFNMYSEYRKYYRKEMSSYCEYLKQKHYFPENEYENWKTRNWRCKIFENGLGHCVQGLLGSREIHETVQKYLGGEI